MDLGRLGLRRSHTTTRNLILRGSTGKLRERGTGVAWDPWKDLDALLLGTTGVAWDPWQDQDVLLLGLEELTLSVERSLTDSSLGPTKEGGHKGSYRE